MNSPAPPPEPLRPPRILSIDALRGVVMATMIFVNDLAGAPEALVPDWMVHYSDRHDGGSGMTFVDLVFPAFLFIVGLSIPFAMGSRLAKGGALWRTVLHILLRTLSLLLLGIMMVHESPDKKALGWSPAWWTALMAGCAILAFCGVSPRRRQAGSEGPGPIWKYLTWALRGLGFAGLAWLAVAFRGRHGERIVTLSPFSIDHSWYGILGLIGWAYFAGSVVYLIFRNHRTALLGCMGLLLCFYPADRKGMFEDFPPAQWVDFGGALGSQAAICVAGVLLATILLTDDTLTTGRRVRFTLWFIGGCAAAAVLLRGLYGISKNNATPSWCLWACAVTAALWLVLHWLADVRRITVISRPCALAGQNVLLAYLISEGCYAVFSLLRISDWYDGLASPGLTSACFRSAGLSILILSATALLNHIGFRLRL